MALVTAVGAQQLEIRSGQLPARPLPTAGVQLAEVVGAVFTGASGRGRAAGKPAAQLGAGTPQVASGLLCRSQRERGVVGLCSP
ncbi:hypothetical protein [Kamptonema formosum]|uniref:hypothetical protein n=1 Tax=Kamptonema formosum TaxID=331992 RepID=UPI00035C3F2D|nr:hypothetical protein [Oscillatoria sp. PCC 10802]